MQPDIDMDKEGAVFKERRNEDIKLNELRQTTGEKFNEQPEPFPSIHKPSYAPSSL